MRTWTVGSVAIVVAAGCVGRAHNVRSFSGERPDAWQRLASRVHAGFADRVSAELELQCTRGSGAACAGLADLLRLGLVVGDVERADALYLRACGRGHAPACRTLDDGVAWLTLPLLRPLEPLEAELEHGPDGPGADRLLVDVCVDHLGYPERIHLRDSTGHDVDDARVVRAIESWRFGPMGAPDVAPAVACQTLSLER